MDTITGDALRTVLRAYPTGVTVVTTSGAAGDHGMTANSFTAVSLEPPLVLLCAAARGRGPATIAANGVFAVNLLAADQEPLSRRFARHDRPRGDAAFDGVEHFAAATGAPILDGACSYLDCRLSASHVAGDHVIFIGEVVALGRGSGRAPLLFHDGRYHALDLSAA